MLKTEDFENEEIINDVDENVQDTAEKEKVIKDETADSKIDVEEIIKKATNKKDEEESEEEKIEKVSVQNVVIEKIKTFLTKISELQKEAAEDEETEVENETDGEKPKYILEYYDLPYRYNETIVRVLAQTPQKLFVYWDISDNDRKKYEDTFGEDFYNKTYPVLLLYNQDKQYVREIEVNDFANSWYIDIDDPKTKYIIQLGRKFRSNNPVVDYNKVNANNIILRNDYLPYAESNMMEAPNDHVLLESLPDFVSFRNVKTGQEMLVNVRELKTMFGHNYDIKAFYDEHYKDELVDGRFDMANPSSKGGLSSSSFK